MSFCCHIFGYVPFHIALDMIFFSSKTYHNDPKYWDRQVCANNEDPDQTLQKQHLIKVYTVCHASSNSLDTSVGSRLNSQNLGQVW